jgi:ribosomal protein L11 methyltransferase
MGTTWTAVTVTAPAELAESIGSFLLDQGAPGLQTEEDRDWVCVTAHFGGAAPLAALDRFLDDLTELFPGRARPEVGHAEVTDGGWAESWKHHFPPLEIGHRLFVHPPWIAEVPPGRIGIVIDPGMAFGTGHHGSTAGCLRLLEVAMEGRPAARVLDLGTGSGVLAIAAAKLGARKITAVDIDPDACRIAAQNAAANGVHDVIRFTERLPEASAPFDLVLANLFAQHLLDLAGDIEARLAPGGVAIGAGILADEVQSVRDAWSAAGLKERASCAEGPWVSLSFQK